MINPSNIEYRKTNNKQDTTNYKNEDWDKNSTSKTILRRIGYRTLDKDLNKANLNTCV